MPDTIECAKGDSVERELTFFDDDRVKGDGMIDLQFEPSGEVAEKTTKLKSYADVPFTFRFKSVNSAP